MKIRSTVLRWMVPCTLTAASVLALVAWQANPGSNNSHQDIKGDTLPKKVSELKRQPGDKDLDLELRQLEQARINLKNVDWEAVNQQVAKALQQVNSDQIKEQVDLALKSVDLATINQQVEASLRNIDFEKIEKQVQDALENAEVELSQVDKEDLKKELAKARKEIAEARKEVKKELQEKKWKQELAEAREESMKDVEKEMAKAKEEIAKAQAEMKDAKVHTEKEMGNANIELDNAKQQLKGYQEMIYSMEKDGLLSTEGNYIIEYKENILKINGKEQSKDVTDKYKKYFKKGSTLIAKADGKMNINHHD